MEQEPALIDIGKFDRSGRSFCSQLCSILFSEVDLNRPAANATEYIKQVIVSREQCPDVVVVDDVDRSKFKPVCLIPKDDSASAVCSFKPSIEWSQVKVCTRKPSIFIF